MFKKVNVKIFVDENMVYDSHGKTVLGVMIKILSYLSAHNTVTTKITLN